MEMEVDTPASADRQSNLPWLEKYRPRVLSDVVGNTDTIKRFKYFATVGNIPHMILAGPPGCGKTTTIHAMAHEMLGNAFSKAVLELNASDDRGIDVVRNRIRQFAETRCTLPPSRHKIVVLDEVDNMTEGAQQALRRIMEKYAGTTRFVLACNQSDKVIEPIQSRCAIVKYTRLADTDVRKRIIQVCEYENVEYVDEGINAVVNTAQGDMRQALNNLQCTAAGYGAITAENVYKVCDEPHPDEILDFFEKCMHGEFHNAFAYLDLQRHNGHAFTDMLTVLHRNLVTADVPEVLKYEFIKILGQTHMSALQGHDGRLQLAALVAKLSNAQKRISE
ncbi:AAA domain-containing protein [Aphelenchoides bicaudatus]|nr:AAA domain-containing protein [Aphelenchoides bicaudatus]